MKNLKFLVFCFLLHFATNNLCFGQAFSPIDPQHVGFDTSSACVKGEFELVVSGPMTGNDGMPLGGYIVNGTQMKDWVNPDDYEGYFSEENGIFGRTLLGQMVLIPYEEFIRKSHIPFEWAFQNGKILVLDGKSMQKSEGKPGMYSAIGFQEDGSLIIFITMFDPVTPKEIAEEIVNLNSFCRNAILLDEESGYSTITETVKNMAFNSQNIKLHLKGYAYGITMP